MKNYTITVNGNVYDVTVEETGAGAAPAPTAPKAAPKAAPKTAPKAAAGAAGSIEVKAGDSRKSNSNLNTTVGQDVKKGDAVLNNRGNRRWKSQL